MCWDRQVSKINKVKKSKMPNKVEPIFELKKKKDRGTSLVVNNQAANARDVSSSPDLGGSRMPVHLNYLACALEPKNHNY